MSEKESRKNLHEERVRMVLLHDLVRKGSTKDCVDVSVEITETINLVNQNTKRLKFGATLQVSLVKERSSAAMGHNRILLALQWVSHKDLFLDHCVFYTLGTLKEKP